MSDEEESLLTEDKDQKQIREELKHMSFENLQKLKNRLGTKVYNETMFGKKKASEKSNLNGKIGIGHAKCPPRDQYVY
ncbi:hypothetical protein DMN91_012966 [Ooceraea biroi]|nr:hypothetical protein DMN91_012966 [Ooceraea biroi]